MLRTSPRMTILVCALQRFLRRLHFWIIRPNIIARSTQHGEDRGLHFIIIIIFKHAGWVVPKLQLETVTCPPQGDEWIIAVVSFSSTTQ